MKNFLKVNIDKIIENIAFTCLMSPLRDIFVITKVRKILLLSFSSFYLKKLTQIQEMPIKTNIEKSLWNCIFLNAKLS